MFHFIFTIIIFLSFSCVNSNHAHRDIASNSAAINEWIQLYKEARSISKISPKKSCDLFEALKQKKPPTSEAQDLVVLRAKQTCMPKGFHLDGLEKWLQKDSLFFGLRHSEASPDVFLKYYKEYQELDATERMEVEFLERYKLVQAAYAVAKQKKNKSTEKKLKELMPTIYVLEGEAVPKESLFEAAYGLRMLRNFSGARKIYYSIISDAKNEIQKEKTTAKKIASYLRMSKAYELLRTNYRVEENKEKGILEITKAVRYMEDFYKKNSSREVATPYVNHSVQLARDLWTQGNLQESRKLLEKTLKIVKKSASLDQVYWVLGRMDQESKKYDEAIENFRKALSVNEDKEFGLKLQWLVAWNLKQHEKEDESTLEFQKLADMGKKQQNDVVRYKALYWLSQIYKKKNQKEDYTDLLEEIAEKNYFGYYGRLAALELEDKEYFSTKNKFSKKQLSHLKEEILENIRIFKYIEEVDVMSSYIQANWRKLGRSERSSYSSKKEYAYYYHFAELYKHNQQFIEILSYDDKLSLYEEHPYFFFPYPYEELIKHHTSKLNVPKEIVYSLMRQESLFDPKARSPADAFGLLQLIPRIAHLYKKQVGVSFENPEDLYAPEVIVPLGAAHLAKLLATYKGSMLLTAASYNAGTIPVNGWLRSKDSSNVFEFIENIPYAETETYAKLVFRNLSFYSLFDELMTPESRIEFLKNYFIFQQEIVAQKESSN